MSVTLLFKEVCTIKALQASSALLMLVVCVLLGRGTCDVRAWGLEM
jgi:hypothetical protein